MDGSVERGDRRSDHRRRRRTAVGLPARRHAAHVRVGDADSADTVDHRDRVPARDRARADRAVPAAIACDCDDVAADGGRGRLGDHAAHHHAAASRSPRPPKPWRSHGRMCTSASIATTRSDGSRIRSTRWRKRSSRVALDLEQRVEQRTSELQRRQPRARSVQLFRVARLARAAARHRRLRADSRRGSLRQSRRDRAPPPRAGQAQRAAHGPADRRPAGVLADWPHDDDAADGRSDGDGDRGGPRSDRGLRHARSSCRLRRCRRATASRRCSTRCSST